MIPAVFKSNFEKNQKKLTDIPLFGALCHSAAAL